MARLRNRSTVPRGMLAPSGLDATVVDPNVQATTRPYGTLLVPSPGYDTIRRGKSLFQRGTPSGGFAPMEFAEDVGGSGAAMSVIPGDTTALEATEWLGEPEDGLPPGDVIIADRGTAGEPSFAVKLHEAYDTIPDMGDRMPGRPLSRMSYSLRNPVAMLRQDWAQDPAITVLGCSLLVILVGILEHDVMRAYRGNRGRGVASAVTAAPAAGAETAGNVTAEALDDIGKAADEAVSRIGEAADTAVNAISDAAKSAQQTVE